MNVSSVVKIRVFFLAIAALVPDFSESPPDSSVRLSVQSLVYEALRGLKSSLLTEYGALALGGEGANLVWFHLAEHQHRPRYFPGLHSTEGFVDLFEPTTARDHVVEVQPTLSV